MKTFPHWIACEHCDSVYERPALGGDEAAHCDTCGAVLVRASRLNVDSWLALTFAAAIAWFIGNICPVIRIRLKGFHNEATLWESAVALAHGAVTPFVIPAALAVIVVPAAQILLLLWVLGFARTGRLAPGFPSAMRLLIALRPWSMIEVALLGILISVIKLSGFLQVLPGVGIWATAALMVLLTLITGRDPHDLWTQPTHEATP